MVKAHLKATDFNSDFNFSGYLRRTQRDPERETWPFAFDHIWKMEQFLCLFQTLPCSRVQKPQHKSAGTSVSAKSQQEIQSRMRYQYNVGACSPGRSDTASHIVF